MNLVLADTEEFRKIRTKSKTGGAPGASSQTVETEAKRTLGLTIVRGAHIVSLSVESPPPADPSTRLGKTSSGGIASTLAAGPGVARAAGRGAPIPPPSLAVCTHRLRLARVSLSKNLFSNFIHSIGSCCWCRRWCSSPRFPWRLCAAPRLPRWTWRYVQPRSSSFPSKVTF